MFTPPAGFWADRDFWAPEIHAYRGKFYLFGTLSAERAKRRTQLFVADGPVRQREPAGALDAGSPAATPRRRPLHGLPVTSLVISGPLFLVGGLFLLNWLQRKQKASGS